MSRPGATSLRWSRRLLVLLVAALAGGGMLAACAPAARQPPPRAAVAPVIDWVARSAAPLVSVEPEAGFEDLGAPGTVGR